MNTKSFLEFCFMSDFSARCWWPNGVIPHPHWGFAANVANATQLMCNHKTPLIACTVCMYDAVVLRDGHVLRYAQIFCTFVMRTSIHRSDHILLLCQSVCTDTKSHRSSYSLLPDVARTSCVGQCFVNVLVVHLPLERSPVLG